MHTEVTLAENSCERSSVTGSDPPSPPPTGEVKFVVEMTHVTSDIPLYEGEKDPKHHWFFYESI